jgi:hypothetical protein
MVKAGLAGTALVCAVLAGPATAATIKPTVKTDDAVANDNCTLREAVEAASTNQPVDACPKGQKRKTDKIPLRKGTYSLVGADGDDENQTGDLDIEGGGPLLITGRGTGSTVVDSPSDDRAFDLFPGSNGPPTSVRLKRMLLDGGSPALWGGVIRADADAGAKLALDQVQLENGELQFGGGIWANSGKVMVKRSTFSGNDARVSSTGFPGVHAIGGAINLQGTSSAKISDTTFFNNNAITNDSSALGGAIALQSSADAVVRRSFFQSNDVYSSSANTSSIRQGGAIWMNSLGELRVVNSTFYANQAFGGGSAARGGAYYGAAAGSSEFAASTFLGNGGTSGSTFLLAGGMLTLSRSAIDPIGAGSVCQVAAGTYETKGYNVAASPFGCALDGPGDKLADPLLDDAPDENGGRTQTVKLKKGSPAIDRIPAKKCKPAEGEDQRRYRRPAGKRCDSGAYERGAKRR